MMDSPLTFGSKAYNERNENVARGASYMALDFYASIENEWIKIRSRYGFSPFLY